MYPGITLNWVCEDLVSTDYMPFSLQLQDDFSQQNMYSSDLEGPTL